MSETEQVVEVVEEETELDPTHTGLIVQEMPQNKKSAEDILWLAENIDALVVAKNKITTAILKMAKPGDWVCFSSDSDKEGKASLGYPGALRIAGPIGISFMDRKVVKIIGRDKIGEWYRYESEVTCTLGNRQVRTWGRAGSRDKLFGFEDKKWKDPSEVNEGNAKMAAIHGAMKEGVKVLLGIPSFPVEDLMEMGIDVKFTNGYKFKSKAPEGGEVSTDDEQDIRNKLRTMLLEVNLDQKGAADMLEALSGFEGKDGFVKGKRMVDYLKGKWLLSTYAKAKTTYKDKFGKEFVAVNG